MSNRGIPAIDRALGRTDRDNGPDGCWTFTGCVVRGYGQIRVDGRSVYVHRFVYEHLVGPIPDGLELDHLCFNRACCNPAHLEPVTHDENQARTRAGSRGQHRGAIERAKTHCPRNHPYDDQNTYRTPDGGRSCRACRRERYAENRSAA